LKLKSLRWFKLAGKKPLSRRAERRGLFFCGAGQYQSEIVLGKTIWNSAPFPSSEFSRTSPLKAFVTRLCTMESPSPVPPLVFPVVKKGSKIRF
jgi:hypothetical protein